MAARSRLSSWGVITWHFGDDAALQPMKPRIQPCPDAAIADFLSHDFVPALLLQSLLLRSVSLIALYEFDVNHRIWYRDASLQRVWRDLVFERPWRLSIRAGIFSTHHPAWLFLIGIYQLSLALWGTEHSAQGLNFSIVKRCDYYD